MKKILIAGIALVLLTSCGAETENNTNTTVNNNVATQNTEDRNQEILNLQPDYKAELYGKVKAVEGNIFTITEIDRSKDPTADMAPAEKRKYMRSLPETERMALKEQIQSATLGDIKVMIPVGIPMIKKELVGDDRIDIEATLADLKPNDIVSIWYDKDKTDRKIAIFVKRSMRK